MKILAKQNLLKLLTGIMTLMLLAGCSTIEMIEENFEPEKGGVLKFSNSESARKDALQLAQNFCRGPIKIQGEGDEWIPPAKPALKAPLLSETESALDESNEPESSAGAANVSEEVELLAKTGGNRVSEVRGSKEASILFLKFRCALQGRRS